MSTHPKRGPLGVSWLNVVFAAALLIAGVLVAVLSARGLAFGLVLCALAVIQFGAAWWAVHRSDNDLARINALEYADERERQVARAGLAAAGAVALIGSLALVVVGFVLDDARVPLEAIAPWSVLVLYGTWGIANWVAAKRM